MTCSSLLVGVDASPESAHAAALASAVAGRAGIECRLVHAVTDYGPVFSVPEATISVPALNEAAQISARKLVDYSLEGVVPLQVRRSLEVRAGRASTVLAEEARRYGSGMVVLGAKRHGALARIGGTTITHLVRLGSVPVLAVERHVLGIRRVLACVDLSEAARPTIEAAECCADLFGAELRVMHSTEPLPVVPGFRMSLGEDEYYRRTRAGVEEAITPLITRPGTDLTIRRGRAAAAIVTEAARWPADLVVVGSHGKGWVDRLLIGSTSERIMQLLPAATLVVPCMAPALIHA
jgi:nucleotide-binding universal stress UspA family protein